MGYLRTKAIAKKVRVLFTELMSLNEEDRCDWVSLEFMPLVLEKIQEKKDVVYSFRIYSLLVETYTGSCCLCISLTDTSAVN